MRNINKLSAAKVSSLNKPGRYGDGGGLWLQVSEWKPGAITKAWLFRYMLHGRPREMGLGSLATFSLKEARDRARQCRQMLSDGIDPIETRREQKMAAKREAANRISFKEAAGTYIAAHKAGWRNAKHADQWTATLETYAYPVIGSLAVADVDTGHVMRIVEPIWTQKTETASRVRGRVEAVLDWAAVRGYRQGDNPARWRGHLDKLLPAKTKVRRVRHQPAMPYADVPDFMARLRGRADISAKALEFTILCTVRTSETIKATWDEIDFAAKTWTIPAARIKAERDHRVPLSDRALEILESLPREDGNPHVFIGGRKGKGLSNMAMLELLKGMDGNGFTVHGFRSSFRDWVAEQTGYPRELAEVALAHALKDKTEAAYQRGDLLEKRRRMMEAWAGYCAKPPAGEVTPMRRAAL